MFEGGRLVCLCAIFDNTSFFVCIVSNHTLTTHASRSSRSVPIEDDIIAYRAIMLRKADRFGDTKSVRAQKFPNVCASIFVFGPLWLKKLCIWARDKTAHREIYPISGGGKPSTEICNASTRRHTQLDSQLYMAAKYTPSIVSISSLFVRVVVFWWSMHSSSMYVCCLQLPVIRYQLAGGWSGNSPLVVCPQQLSYIPNHLTSCVVSLPSTDRYLQLHYH